MRVLVNFNEYLGGGETLLIRYADFLNKRNSKYLVLTSDDSYISQFVDVEFLEIYNKAIDFQYMRKFERDSFVSWLITVLESNDEPLDIVTFCLRDLHIINNVLYQFSCQYKVTVTHLLLHPLDHLYMCQSIGDKVISKLFGYSRYSLNQNIEGNKELLRNVYKNKNLISMNFNVTNRLFQDTSISTDKQIIPLPFIESNFNTDSCAPDFDSDFIKIVWVGRIVDFKIPAILAMINYVAENKKVKFDIVGYGNEKIIRREIKKFDVADRVNILGKVAHSNLKGLLSKYHIGYGMGTSVIELTSIGLPTVVALAQPSFRPFANPICAGVLYEQPLGNVGDDLYSDSKLDNYSSIGSAIDQILMDPADYLRKLLDYVSINFDNNVNFSRYEKHIDNAKEYCAIQSKLVIGTFKRLAYRAISHD